MNTQTITREQVIALAMNMPQDKLTSWYEYGLFIQNNPIFTTTAELSDDSDAELQAEFAAWDAASDADWLAFEEQLQDDS